MGNDNRGKQSGRFPTILKGLSMVSQALGEIRIDRVVESEGAFAPASIVMPQFDRKVLERDQADAWLRPRYITDDDVLIMSFQSFVIRSAGLTILVDGCVGNDKERPNRPTWHRRTSTAWLDQLASLGLSPDDIDVVLCTHLHADHVGWNTVLRDGRWVPTFPRAQYLFAKAEYNHWEREHRASLAKGGPLTNHGSFADSVLPVMEAGQAELVGDGHEVCAGVRIEAAPGHTPGNSVISVSSGGQRALITGDVVHTPVQIAVPQWSSKFCEDPQESAQCRERLLRHTCDTGTLLFAAHFPTPTAGWVESSSGGRMRFRCVDC